MLRFESETGAIGTLRPGVASPEAALIAMPDGTDIVLWDSDEGEVARVPAPVENTAECAYPGLAAWSIEWASPGELQLTAQSGERWVMDVAIREWEKVE